MQSDWSSCLGVERYTERLQVCARGARRDAGKSREPVEGSASLHSHPVDGKVHLSDESGHTDGHGVSRPQHDTGLLPHDPTGGGSIERGRPLNMIVDYTLLEFDIMSI